MARQKRREFKKELPCALTAVERDAKAKMLSQALSRIEKLKADKKEKMGEFNVLIKDQEQLLAEIREHYDSGKEPRPVQCVEYITDHGTIEVERTDTSEVVETRRAVESELQLDLPEKKAEKKKKESRSKKPSPPKAPKAPKAGK
jgi:type IV secretory pathway VirJ component